MRSEGGGGKKGGRGKKGGEAEEGVSGAFV